MQIEGVIPLARQLLTIPINETCGDLWLWEHAERVMRITQMIAHRPNPRGERADLTALAAAALFHDAGWVLEYQQGRYERWQLLTRPTSDIQRELGAALLHEQAGHLLDGPTARLAGEAIRHCNDRRTTLLEARVLADAEALDEIGMIYVLRQFRQYQAEGRPLLQLAETWQRQKEYRYWEVRLSDGFHDDALRELARQRLTSVDVFMAAVARDVRGADVEHWVREAAPVKAP